MSIQFTCAVCGKRLTAPNAAAGKPGKCSNCGELLKIPALSSAPARAEISPITCVSNPSAPVKSGATGDNQKKGTGDATKQCPFCAETIKAAATRCRFCGSILKPKLEAVPLKQGEIVCPNPNCNYCGKPQREAKGSLFVAITLMLFFLLPGILYLVFASGYRYKCPQCGLVLRTDLVQ